MLFRICMALAMCFGAPVLADVPDRLEAAFRGWVDNVGAEHAVMTVRRNGQPVRDVTIGMVADAPVELASTGKAITAACVAVLIERGIWQQTTTSRAVLGYGPEGLSVAQLLTHTAGLGPDGTQITMGLRLFQPDAPLDWAARGALVREKQTGAQGSYSYNNENYAVLGAMIEAQTGQEYAAFCADAVLAPAGVSIIEGSPVTGAFLPFGGWKMSVQDFAAFHWHNFGPQGRIGRAPDQWPTADLGRGTLYGMGTIMRAMQGTHNYWHFGLLCFPGRLNAGSYAVIWLEEYSAVAAYDACVTWDQMFALDGALVAAVFQ